MSQTNRHVKLDEVWAKLLVGINHVYQCQSMKKSAYILLYTYMMNSPCSLFDWFLFL